MPNETVLSISELHVGYGPIKAVRGCSLDVAKGECVAVIGANGAGKTTLLRALSAMLKPDQGSIAFQGRPVQGRAPHDLARAGMLHIPEGRGTLGTMSVWENLRVAYDIRPCAHGFEEGLSRAFTLFPRLGERREQVAGNLSGGEQQMLALARAIVNPPEILLLDEPSLGLSPRMVSEAYRALRAFRDGGMTILLVEQNVRLALRFAHRGHVLKQGRIVLSGPSGELLENPTLLSHYLGSTAQEPNKEERRDAST